MLKKVVIGAAAVFAGWWLIKKIRGKGKAKAKGRVRTTPKMPPVPAEVQQATAIIAARCKALKIVADVRPILVDEEWTISVMPKTANPDEVREQIPDVANGIEVVVQ